MKIETTTLGDSVVSAFGRKAGVYIWVCEPGTEKAFEFVIDRKAAKYLIAALVTAL